MMDRISLLSDDLLTQILSLIPTKDVLVTSVLSKRWKSVWMMVPKLHYDDSNYRTRAKYRRFLRFVDRSLLLCEAPILESLRLTLSPRCSPSDISTWLTFAVRRSVSELEIHHYSNQMRIRLPRIVFNGETLVVLKLNSVRIVDVPFRVCFPKLKTLHLHKMEYPDNESFHRLLSSCPCLEEMDVALHSTDNLTSLTVQMPTLQNLMFDISGSKELMEFEINAPSLKYLILGDYRNDLCLNLYIPEVVYAYVYDFADPEPKFFHHLTSVRQLRLHLFAGTVYPAGCVLHQLVHLDLGTFSFGCDLVMSLFEHSPKLRVFNLDQAFDDIIDCKEVFEEPKKIPNCLLFHLEASKWKGYSGAYLEKEVATYILRNGRCLKAATFFLRGRGDDRVEAMKELELSPRASDSCKLVFF